MQRRIIQQSASSMGISLPSKCIKENNLKKGDSLNLEIVKKTIQITSDKKQTEKRHISLNIPSSRETAVRMLIVSAYRLGYDTIKVNVQEKNNFNSIKKLINQIAEKNLIGFEMISSSKEGVIIESVAEPDYDNFHVLIEKQFFIIQGIIENLLMENISHSSNLVQKYDNFLKRCISKRILSIHNDPSLWQMLTYLTRISRSCLYFNKYLQKSHVKLSNKEEKLFNEVKELFIQLKNSYFKKDQKLLFSLHEKHHKILREDIHSLMKKNNPVAIHFIAEILDNIYYTTSSITAIIEE